MKMQLKQNTTPFSVSVISMPTSFRWSSAAASAATTTAVPFTADGSSQYELWNTKLSLDGSLLSVNLSAMYCSISQAQAPWIDEQIPTATLGKKYSPLRS